ncbi:unnamed protein product [Mytilus edulis]|uniref:Uncharacterized protein n=1 Tax=Mytilus edulis TaxID=6550 RepID=A0A8S3T8N3_MYTED|nr:unnamed protein product [Mytilus edulis]
MSHSKTESLHFYAYLCQKIGSEAVVKARRLLYISRDSQSQKLYTVITSGSKGEGLDLKGSDLDIMLIDPMCVVYKSDNDIVQDWRIALVMDTEDTLPCFTQLQLHNNVNNLSNVFKQTLHQHRGKHLLSNELYKSQTLHRVQDMLPKLQINIHGPCFSHFNIEIDLAFCLKCDQTSRYCISKLSETVIEYSHSREQKPIAFIYNFILLGIAFQMLGETDLARTYFRSAAQYDFYGLTSAAFRLRQFC